MIELQQTPDTNIIIANAKGKITGDDYGIPGEVKYFSNDQLADAEAWITA